MNDIKARFVIATLAFALRDESLPSRVTDRQISKEHRANGCFTKDSFDFTLDDGTRVWGQRTSSRVTAHVDNSSQKVTLEYQGSSSSTKVTRAEDEKNSIVFSQVDYSGNVVVLNGSAGRFEYFI